MRILIQVGVNRGGKRGISVVLENLLRHIARLDKENEYFLYCHFFTDYRRKVLETFDAVPKQPNIHLCIKRWPERAVNFLENTLCLPVQWWYFKHWLKIDIYHNLSQFHPPLPGIISVVTAQDTFFEHLEFFPGAPWSAEFIRETLRSADWVIAVSHTIRDELERLSGIDPRKMAVIPHGVATETFRPTPASELAWVRDKYNLPRKYLLAVGPFALKDNIDVLLAAFARLAKQAAFQEHRLVLVGPVDTGAPIDIDAMIAQAGLSGRVLRIGYVSPQSPELVGIYNLADALVFLSSHEGIGLPPLEAMACGVPVVAANASAVPEFVGDAGLLVDPKDPIAVAEAVASLERDPALKRRNISRGLEKAQGWSWEQAARDTLALWKRAYAGRKP